MDLYNLSDVFVLYDLMIVFYMFSAVLLWLLHDDKSNDSFSLTGRLMCFHFYSYRNEMIQLHSYSRYVRLVQIYVFLSQRRSPEESLFK